MLEVTAESLLGRRVAVYRNLRTGGYSVKPTVSGRVLGVVSRVVLEDVRFHIQPGGQQRCRNLGVRGVHAYVMGTVVTDDLGAVCSRRVTYHFNQPTFSLKDTGQFLARAFRCRLDDVGAWVCLAAS